MKLISVHLPKTAGSSFRSSLEVLFKEKLYKDYQGSGIALSAFEKNRRILTESLSLANKGLLSFDCIHGHFPPAKYLLLNDLEPLTFITWMREPVSRMISHYYYWQRAYDPKRSAPHHKQVIEENWSLEEFCLNERFRNIYSKYLWGFPLEYFDFIGITEHYEEDFHYFTKKYFNKKLPIRRDNASQQMYNAGLSPEVLEKIKKFHSKDLELYQRALDIRQQNRK